MSAVVVQDEVNLSSPGSFPLDLLEEGEKLAMTLPRHAGADDPSVQNVEGGEQSRRAVTDIVMGLSRRDAGP